MRISGLIREVNIRRLFSRRPCSNYLGHAAITEKTMPPIDRPRIVGQTGYHIRSGEHNLKSEDWKWFLDFADGIMR